MKRSNLFAFFVTLAILCVAVGSALSQETNLTKRVGEILEEAGCPLTETQIEKLNKLGSGPDSRRGMMEILDDKQNEALRKRWGDRRSGTRGPRGRDRGAGFGRNIVQILNDTDYPLTEEQLKKLKDIEPGPDSREKIMEILDDNQKKELEKAREQRGQRGGEPGAFDIKFVVQALKNAGCALTESQMEQLKDLQPGREFFRGMMDILDEKQGEALRNSSAMSLMFMAPALENAGCPLTEAQIEKILTLPGGRDPESRKKMMDVLDEKQKKALENTMGRRRR